MQMYFQTTHADRRGDELTSRIGIDPCDPFVIETGARVVLTVETRDCNTGMWASRDILLTSADANNLAKALERAAAIARKRDKEDQ